MPTNPYEICNNMKSEWLQLYERGSKVQIDEFSIYCCGIRRSLRSVTGRFVWISCPHSVTVLATTAFRIVMQFGIEVLYKKLSGANVNVVKFGSVTILLCLRAQMNF